MTAIHRSAAKRERETAAALGTRRVHRQRGERAPDVEPIRLACGAVLVAECKERKPSALPGLIKSALEQARGYAGAGAIPLAVIFAKGTRKGIACMPLAALAGLLGLDVEALPAPTPLKRKKPSSPLQGELFPTTEKKKDA